MTQRYTVTGWKSARQELAEIWLRSTEQAEVSRFINTLDIDLARQPETVGNEFHEGIRVVAGAGLVIYFTISSQDCLVEVMRLRRQSG